MPCPPEETLRRFLAERLEDAEQEAVARHIDGCPRCQQALEQFSEEGPAARWRRLAPRLEAIDRPPTGEGQEQGHAGGLEGCSGAWPPAGPLGVPSLFSDPWLGRRIGPYRIQGTLGQGGMGTVYLVERETDYQQQAALKLIQAGAASEAVLRRFRNEIRLQAALSAHPNIAGLLDAGRTEDGLPYLVMEYVDGEPIDEFCDRRRCDTRQRLKLFGTVCAAVAFAHQHAVIHRDLKLNNILVNQDGEVRLIDFGIAKALDGDGEGEPVTQTGQLPLTPHYASPEQARGEPLTIASDVYSLGVVLYELLTGHRPYQIDSRRPDQFARVISEKAPLRPSQVVETPSTVCGRNGETVEVSPAELSRRRGSGGRRLQRLLAGDLDNILLKALHKDPARRYRSVEALAEDIDHHLAGLPVRARGDSFVYRSARLLRRHWGAAAVALMIALSLLLGAAGMALQWRRANENAIRAEQAARQAAAAATQQAKARLAAEKAQREAQRQADSARRTAQFLVGLFQGADPIGLGGSRFGAASEGHPEASARELLDRGARWIDTALTEEPDMQAALLDAVGVVYLSLGEVQAAAPRLERALEIRRRRLSADHPDLARTLTAVGALRYVQGNYAPAIALLREAASIMAPLAEERGADLTSIHFLLAITIVEGAPRHRGEAVALLRQVVQTRRELPEVSPRERAFAHIALATALRAEGETAEALDHLAQAQQIISRDGQVDPIADCFAIIVRAIIDWQVGRREAAIAGFREALSLARQTVGPWHPAVHFYQVRLAGALQKQGAWDAAEELYRDAAERARKIYGRQPRTARTLRDLAQFLADRDHPQEAAQLLRETTSIFTETLGENHPATQSASEMLAAAESSVRGAR